MNKPTVHYRDVMLPVVVGASALVHPVDHSSELVSNKKWARTSPVICVVQGENGPLFETENTLYRPMDGLPTVQSVANPDWEIGYGKEFPGGWGVKYSDARAAA